MVARPADFEAPESHEERILRGQRGYGVHLGRYVFAAQRFAARRVLDVGCGIGYGSWELVARNPAIEMALGTDLSSDAVRYGKEHFADGKLSFLASSAKALPFNNHTFDLVTCFEVIEHVSDPDCLLSEIRRVLKPDGYLLMSTPNGLLPPWIKPANPYHKVEWPQKDFLRLFSRWFSIEEVFGQAVMSRQAAVRKAVKDLVIIVLTRARLMKRVQCLYDRATNKGDDPTEFEADLPTAIPPAHVPTVVVVIGRPLLQGEL